MAFTLAHPAAIIPLRGLRYLALLPMIVGSLVPDLIGYLPYDLEYRVPHSHSPVGTLLTDVPAGYVVLLLLLVFRRSIVLPLWEPHRSLIAVSLDGFFARPRRWLIALPSLLVGSWTHIVWDRFTHATPWTYRHLPLLYQPVFPDGDHALHLYHVLQYTTSAIGLVYIARSYGRKLRHARGSHDPEAAGRRKAWLLTLLVTTAVAAGTALMASGVVQVLSIYGRLSLFLKTAIVIFALLYGVSCLVLARTAQQQRT